MGAQVRTHTKCNYYRATQPVANLGLGAKTSDIVSSEDDEFDAYRKRMMLAYRFRPNPLVSSLHLDTVRFRMNTLKLACRNLGTKAKKKLSRLSFSLYILQVLVK